MKDITAVLLHYDHPQAIQRALSSLQKIQSRLRSIIIFIEKSTHFQIQDEEKINIQFIQIDDDIGVALNKEIKKIDSTYVMFLQYTDYVSPQIQQDTLHLPEKKTVLGTYDSNQLVSHPFLIRTASLKETPFLSSQELPFKEALLPVWMSEVEQANKLFKKNVIRKLRQSRNRDTIEKQSFIGKYQREKKDSKKPTLTIILPNYNMEKYVAAAIRSCLLQTKAPDQIIVIDDGSSDQSQMKIERIHARNLHKFYSKVNAGKAKALNTLLPHVTSDFILELDADDFLDPNAVSIIKKQLLTLPEDVAVLYGNWRRWKQTANGLLIKGVAKGRPVRGIADLLTYRFPLGPRIYRTAFLREIGGFPVIPFKEGRLYEDVTVLHRLIKKYPFQYNDFTVYNVRQHSESITKQTDVDWNEYLKVLDN